MRRPGRAASLASRVPWSGRGVVFACSRRRVAGEHREWVARGRSSARGAWRRGVRRVHARASRLLGHGRLRSHWPARSLRGPTARARSYRSSRFAFAVAPARRPAADGVVSRWLARVGALVAIACSRSSPPTPTTAGAVVVDSVVRRSPRCGRSRDVRRVPPGLGDRARAVAVGRVGASSSPPRSRSASASCNALLDWPEHRRPRARVGATLFVPFAIAVVVGRDDSRYGSTGCSCTRSRPAASSCMVGVVYLVVVLGFGDAPDQSERTRARALDARGRGDRRAAVRARAQPARGSGEPPRLRRAPGAATSRCRRSARACRVRSRSRSCCCSSRSR